MANAVRKRNTSSPSNLFTAAGDVGFNANCISSTPLRMAFEEQLRPRSNGRRRAIAYFLNTPARVAGPNALSTSGRRSAKNTGGMLKYHSHAGHNLPEIHLRRAVSEAPAKA